MKFSQNGHKSNNSGSGRGNSDLERTVFMELFRLPLTIRRWLHSAPRHPEKEWELLVAKCASVGLDATSIVRRHGLTPILYHVGFKNFFGDWMAARLFYDLRTKLVGELSDAGKSLDLPVMALKGLGSAVHLYPEPHLRPMSDLDIWLPYGSDDFANKLIIKGFLADESPTAHARSYKKAGLAVDVHRRFSTSFQGQGPDLLGILQRASTMTETAGLLLPTLADHTELLLWHCARNAGQITLLQYLDLALALSQCNLNYCKYLNKVVSKIESGWSGQLSMARLQGLVLDQSPTRWVRMGGHWRYRRSLKLALSHAMLRVRS